MAKWQRGHYEMVRKKDIIFTEDTPTVKKMRAITELLNTGTIAFETLIPQMIIVLLFGGSTAYLVITGQSVPDWLLTTDGLIVGFYFGSDFEYRRIKGKVS